MSHDPTGIDTMDRLLAAAAEVFSEVGYRSATLREICRRGRANIAAVNYYFRDKEQLFTAVVQRLVTAAGESLERLTPAPTQTPEEKLRHFIREFLHNLLGVDRPVQLLRLVSHEMVDPTPALEFNLETAVRPMNAILQGIVVELTDGALTPEELRNCMSSILAQCSSYHHSESLIKRLDQIDVHDPATIEHLAEHIVRFSLGGIRAMADRRQALRSTPATQVETP